MFKFTAVVFAALAVSASRIQADALGHHQLQHRETPDSGAARSSKTVTRSTGTTEAPTLEAVDDQEKVGAILFPSDVEGLLDALAASDASAARAEVNRVGDGSGGGGPAPKSVSPVKSAVYGAVDALKELAARAKVLLRSVGGNQLVRAVLVVSLVVLGGVAAAALAAGLASAGGLVSAVAGLCTVGSHLYALLGGGKYLIEWAVEYVKHHLHRHLYQLKHFVHQLKHHAH